MATLAASLSFGRIAGLEACGPTGGAGPIIAFELARTPEAVRALFGAEPCTSRFVEAQREALWLDLLGFIPAYTLFLVSAAAALRKAGLGLALVAFSLFLFAGALDEIEGAVMFRILAQLPGTPQLLDALFWTVRPKFALLGLGEVLLAFMLWRGQAAAKVGAGVLITAGLVSLYYLFVAPHDPLMMKAHSYGWTALLVLACIGAVRPQWVNRA